MDQLRYPRLCVEELMRLTKENKITKTNIVNKNWFHEFKNYYNLCNFTEIWDSYSLEIIVKRMPLFYKRIFSQIRLLNIYNPRIIVNKEKYIVETNHRCPLCGLEPENLIHMLTLCPAYNAIRYKYWKIFVCEDITADYWFKVMFTSEPSLIKTFVLAMYEILKYIGQIRNVLYLIRNCN